MPRVMTDALGGAEWQIEFDPFGNKTRVGSEYMVNNLRFPGQYFDAESGLHYNYFRDYDPKTGRYIEPDPIGLKGGANVYSYALNNPLKYTDPKGLESCNGQWRVEKWEREATNWYGCICYWLCRSCDAKHTALWGGRYRTLPSTRGKIMYTGFGSGDAGSGDFCLCEKPGPERNCDPCQ